MDMIHGEPAARAAEESAGESRPGAGESSIRRTPDCDAGHKSGTPIRFLGDLERML